MEDVGSGIGQDPATEVTHLGLNQPPFFSSARTLACVHMSHDIWGSWCVLVCITLLRWDGRSLIEVNKNQPGLQSGTVF